MRIIKDALIVYAFGAAGLAVRKLTNVLKDGQVRRMMDALRASLKLTGDGYALVQDNLCLSESDTSMKEIAAQLQ